MVSASRCYKIGPGEGLKRKELGRGRGLLVKSAATKGQWIKMMRSRKKGAPSAESLKMASPISPPPEKLNGALLDANDAISPLKWENASSSIGEDNKVYKLMIVQNWLS